MSDTKHEQILHQIFTHPISHNLVWHELIAALRTIGAVEEVSNGKYHFSRNGRTLTFDEPGAKEVGEEVIMRLRRFLNESDKSIEDTQTSDSAIIIVTHDDVSVYRAPNTSFQTHQEFKAEDLYGFRRRLHHKGIEKDNSLPAHEEEYYKAVADALIGIERSVLISNATGSSSSGSLFMREFKKRHHVIAAKIQREVHLDLEAMTERQLVVSGAKILETMQQ